MQPETHIYNVSSLVVDNVEDHHLVNLNQNAQALRLCPISCPINPRDALKQCDHFLCVLETFLVMSGHGGEPPYQEHFAVPNEALPIHPQHFVV